MYSLHFKALNSASTVSATLFVDHPCTTKTLFILADMKAHSHQNPKLKPPPRPLFSCGFFRHCTQTIPSPTTPSSPPPPPSLTQPPPTPLPPPPPTTQLLPPPPQDSSSSTTTSSSSTSQSFTQWRFPTPMSPQQQHPPPLPPTPNLQHLFHISMLQLASGSHTDSITALHSLESSLLPNPQPDPICPPELLLGVVRMLNYPPAARSATKVLLALCLAEHNRRIAVEVGAVGGVIEAVGEMERTTAERALAALELMCTVAEGAADLRSHALAVPMVVEMMGRLEGHRGKEYAMSVLAVIYGESSHAGAAPLEEVARAVSLALQGECSARGRRKGALLLKILEESNQRLDVDHDV